MKSITTLLFILFAIVTFFACNKLKDCITYPEDTVPICGKTHTLISGKTWDLDSVILNGKNITQQVWDSLGAESYSFRISTELQVAGGLTPHADAIIFIGNQGHEAEFVKPTGLGVNVDNLLTIVGEDSVTFSFQSVAISHLYRVTDQVIKAQIVSIRKLKNTSLKLNADFNDTLIENYFSVK